MIRALVVTVWVLLAVIAIACEAVAVAGKARIGDLRALREFLTGSRVVTVILLLGWMWVGWHFFAR